MDLTEILETIRILEAIFEVYENRSYPPPNPYASGRGSDKLAKPHAINQVQIQESCQRS